MQDAVVAEVFRQAGTADITPLRAGGQVFAGLVVVQHAGSAWWVSITPDRRSFIRNANGAAHRFKGEQATEQQDKQLRTRMLFEFGGNW